VVWRAGLFSWLKSEFQANAVAARWTNTGAGEEAGKIDQIEPVVKVLHVGLQAHEEMLSLYHRSGPDRCPQSKRRPYWV
jgi:hypothetical protein